MVPSRRVAILFVTTLLSTRPLLAQFVGVADQERAGSPRSTQSRSVVDAPISTHGDDCPKEPPALIGPGDDSGDLVVPNPIHFSWHPAPGASRYRVVYSLERGTGKDFELGVTTATHFVADMPEGEMVKWKVYALGPDDECSGANSSNLKFTVGGASSCEAASISVSPSSSRITAGDSVTLTATVSGSTPITVRWFEGAAGDRSRQAGTGTSFSTRPSSSTSYWAEASNACGTAMSNTAVVEVCQPARVVSNSGNQTVTAGQAATLIVTAAGDAPLAYAWYEGASGDRGKRVGTGSSYTTPALTAPASYWAEATNSCGSDATSTIVVDVCLPASIDGQPADSEVTEGSSATLSVSAAGSGPLSYQWYRGSTPVGTNSNTLDTGTLTATATFHVVVANACGSVTSRTATVTVRQACVAPAISAQPSDAEVIEGSATTLSVTATGTAPLSYQWYRGNTPVGTNSNTLDTGALTATTTFHVVVANACGSVTSRTATVTVRPACVAPAISAQPADAEVVEGSSATLSVAATGTSPLSYQWYRGSTPVGTNSSILDTGALTATTTFHVVVANACGAVTSGAATVTVRSACVAPAITAQPTSTEILEGSSATLTVTATGTAPIAYQWYRGTTPVGTNSSTLDTGALTATTTFHVVVANACGTATSSTAVVRVTPYPGSDCRPLVPPRPSAVAVVTSGVAYTVAWPPVESAGRYTIDEATDPSFDGAVSRSVTDAAATFSHDVTGPVSYYYRVRAVSACDAVEESGPSQVIRVAVVPPVAAAVSTATDLVVPFHERRQHQTVVRVPVDPNATGFTATSSEAWMTVSPASGGVPPDGVLTFTLTLDAMPLPHGTSMASLRVVTTGAAGRIGTNGSSATTVPISISLVTPVSPFTPAGGGEALIVPAVAHADGSNSRWQSDLRIAHTYPSAIRYLLTFRPSGAAHADAVQTEVAVRAGETVALDDLLGRWFGAGMASAGATGVLEIRTLDAILGQGRTLATSRLFNAASSGSFGQFIAAVPLAKFLARSSSARQTLVAVAQSAAFRSNLGLVEGSGKPANVRLEVFDGAGLRMFETMLSLGAGEHRQIGSVLAANGIEADNARVDVSLVSGSGSVFSYASVIDNATGDPSFVPPVEVSGPRARRYTIAGAANLTTAGGKWQTDLRLYNGSAASTTATVEFFREGQWEAAATRELTVESGQVAALDDVLQSLLGVTGAGGALRITTPVDSALVPAARTFHARSDGTFGQFVPAATEENAAAAGGEALRILQVEESARFRSNIGLTEVSGAPATIEIRASLPGKKLAAVTQVELQPNEFRQLNGLLRSMGFEDAYNATVDVRVIGGTGSVIAYASVVDNATQDPTYVMAQ
jgi:Ig-like domain CHU_C associated